MAEIYGELVSGIEIDEQTRCSHYKSEVDIIAIKFKCCLRWYPCIDCHEALADHSPAVWPHAEFMRRAILCGSCGYQLNVAEYLSSNSICPNCSSGFNPACVNHYHLYFEKNKETG